MFVPGKATDSTVAVAVVVPSIAAVVIVIVILFYCYKVKNRYRLFHELPKDFTMSQILTSFHRKVSIDACRYIFAPCQFSVIFLSANDYRKMNSLRPKVMPYNWFTEKNIVTRAFTDWWEVGFIIC